MKINKIQSFLVYWFLSFLVPSFLGFEVSWFQSFRNPMIPYYQMSISCFLIDIDLIFKIFKNLLHGSSGLSAPVFSKTLKLFDVQHFAIDKTISFGSDLGFFLDFVEVSWGLK